MKVADTLTVLLRSVWTEGRPASYIGRADHSQVKWDCLDDRAQQSSTLCWSSQWWVSLRIVSHYLMQSDNYYISFCIIIIYHHLWLCFLQLCRLWARIPHVALTGAWTPPAIWLTNLWIWNKLENIFTVKLLEDRLVIRLSTHIPSGDSDYSLNWMIMIMI